MESKFNAEAMNTLVEVSLISVSYCNDIDFIIHINKSKWHNQIGNIITMNN